MNTSTTLRFHAAEPRTSSRGSDAAAASAAASANSSSLGCCADEHGLGRGHLGVHRHHRGERDARVRDRAVVGQLEVRGDRDRGVVADLALELLVRAAGAAGRYRDPDLGDHLVVGERVGEDVGDEVGDRDRPFATRTAGDHLGTGREQHRVPVALGVAVRDRAAERAAVAHERVGDPRRGRRRRRRTRGRNAAMSACRTRAPTRR